MQRNVSFAELAMIAGTRLALGIGVGLLLSRRLTEEQQRAAGIALVAVGGLSTIPLAIGVLGRTGSDRNSLRPAA